jgi:hypothetical protein
MQNQIELLNPRNNNRTNYEQVVEINEKYLH